MDNFIFCAMNVYKRSHSAFIIDIEKVFSVRRRSWVIYFNIQNKILTRGISNISV